MGSQDILQRKNDDHATGALISGEYFLFPNIKILYLANARHKLDLGTFN
jgi:hypothetical protein